MRAGATTRDKRKNRVAVRQRVVPGRRMASGVGVLTANVAAFFLARARKKPGGHVTQAPPAGAGGHPSGSSSTWPGETKADLVVADASPAPSTSSTETAAGLETAKPVVGSVDQLAPTDNDSWLT